MKCQAQPIFKLEMQLFKPIFEFIYPAFVFIHIVPPEELKHSRSNQKKSTDAFASVFTMLIRVCIQDSSLASRTQL